ncbi:nitroreductase family protein [Clostridium sediminicola]|uniref:nitroreductase family protein n=1 Tax=Clostridium sediminicola TaxID=3114879 RepID=UPI0031F245E0
MDFYSVIEQRKSVKKFNGIKVKDSSLDRMINAAMMSPSWKNLSSYKFIIVEDSNKKSKIADSIKNKTNEASNAINEAPILVVFVGNPELSETVEGKDMYLLDAAIAMEHLVLAATEEGYGTCWMASFEENKVKEALDIPDEIRVIAMTPVGKPEEVKEHYPKKDVRDYVYLNNWNNAYTENIHH